MRTVAELLTGPSRSRRSTSCASPTSSSSSPTSTRREQFYVDLLGLVVTAAHGRRALPARAGRSACTTRSCCARAESPAVARSASASRADGRPRRRSPSWYEARGLRRRTWVDGASSRQGRALRVHDPLGFPLEFFYEMEQVERLLQRYDLHRGAPIMRIDHVNLHVPDVERGVRASGRQLGFRCSEYISTDGLRRATHGRVAAPQADRPRRRAHRRPRARACTTSRSGSPSRAAITARLRPARRRRHAQRDRARARTARRLERVLRLPPRPGRPSHRALHVRLLHGRPGPRADALVGRRRALPLVLGHPRAGQLVRGVDAVLGPDGAAGRDDASATSTSAISTRR